MKAWALHRRREEEKETVLVQSDGPHARETKGAAV